jgi:hypothetical protein
MVRFGNGDLFQFKAEKKLDVDEATIFILNERKKQVAM